VPTSAAPREMTRDLRRFFPVTITSFKLLKRYIRVVQSTQFEADLTAISHLISSWFEQVPLRHGSGNSEITVQLCLKSLKSNSCDHCDQWLIVSIRIRSVLLRIQLPPISRWSCVSTAVFKSTRNQMWNGRQISLKLRTLNYPNVDDSPCRSHRFKPTRD